MAHCNTLFSQMLALIPRHVFQKLERRHAVGRSSRKFGFKEQFTLLAFIQLAARRSMRDGLRSLATLGRKLYHFGLKLPALSTVSDANNTRPTAFFTDLFSELYKLCQPIAPKHNFRFKSNLYSMDATTISLCLSIFPWAKHRKNKGGIKVNTVLDHDGHIPAFICVTEAKKHESKIAQSINLPKNSIVTFDKAYNDYRYFQLLNQKNIYFVTRLKKNAVYKVVKRCSFTLKTGVVSDHIIEVKVNDQALRLRCVKYEDTTTGKMYEFLTNNFKLAAKTISNIYKERWKIELFFKEIKQNLHIKKFIGHSENAVIIQIYTALTVYLLLAYQKFLAKINLSVQQILEIVTLNLLGTDSLEILLRPPKQKSESIYYNSLLALVA